MHNFYVSCSQQDKLQEFKQPQPRSFQSSFRRSANQPSKDVDRRCSKANYILKNTTNVRSSHSEHDSSASPPSLGSSSPSSLEDETSPKTPSPGYCNPRLSQRSKENHVSKPDLSSLGSATTWPTYHVGSQTPSTNTTCTARSLPSRLKRNDENQPFGAPSNSNQYDTVPPVIQETVTRSRLARDVKRSTSHGQQSRDEVATNVPNAVVTFNSRCHARRRPCADAQTLAPPKLKRDTDCTEALVRLIVCLSTKLVHAIWSQSAATPKTSSAFNGAGVLPLRVFIQETLRRSKTSYSTLQVALYYLILLKPHVNSYHSMQEQGVPACRALQCGRRMFLTALILASKYLQDRNYSSRAWSKISGLPIAEINENERRYLNLIQFNLHMKKEAFENWSKITLSLCKIGEAGNLESMSMVFDAARVGSDDWWSYQLRRLTAELVQDSKQTDEYLSSLTISKTGDDVSSEQLIASLDTPPSSPESVDEGLSENSITKVLSRGSSDYFSSSKPIDLSSSPASSLPSRPSLPNLPTPSTTPRYNHTLPWPRGSCQPNIRCQASSQALLNLDKQAMNTANLDTCPPPKPRPGDMPRSMSYPTRRAPSNLGTALVASSLTCSPESTVSDASCSTTRSRSSSISSNSSLWFASGRHDSRAELTTACASAISKESQPLSTYVAAVPASYSFYHSSDRTPCRFEDEGIVINTSQASQPSITNTVRFLDEGYGSDGRSEFIHQKIADAIASMATGEDRSDCSAATVDQTLSTGADQVQRRHKRTHSSITESSVHDHVRQLMWSSQPAIEVVDRLSPLSVKTTKEKEVQHPEKEWAELKRPVPNNMYNKRVALQHCNNAAGSAAAELAANFLRDAAMAN